METDYYQKYLKYKTKYFLLKGGVKSSKPTPEPTPERKLTIFDAINRNDMEKFWSLIKDQNFRVDDMLNEYYVTPLLLAIERDNLKMVYLLLNKKRLMHGRNYNFWKSFL